MMPHCSSYCVYPFSGSCDVGDGQASSALPKRWGKSRPYPAHVAALEGLCNISGKDDKNTFRVEFDLGDSGLVYQPGDALGIYPTNSSQVTRLTRTSLFTFNRP